MLFDELIQLLDPEPHSAALNMAIDEALLRSATGPLLRVYRWERPAVSFGCFTKYAAVERLWPCREHVRRWTGGGVVPHGDDCTFTLVVPQSCAFARGGAAESYRAIHECVGRALAGVGGAIRLASAAAAKVSDACFENAVRHDILVGERKVVGGAQRRTRVGLLHQGSIQQAQVPADFSARLAATLSAHVIERDLAAADLAAATQLAAEKYATDAWLRRF